METANKRFGISGSMLKVLALIFMTVDHIGYLILPQLKILRIIGRLAMPIFAYMVAEGCYYTRNRKKHILTMAVFALLCQIGYYIGMRSLYMCIFVTFSMSIVVIYAADRARKKLTIASAALLAAAICGVFFVCEVMPILLTKTDFGVDYGFWGVMLPVFIFLGRNKWEKLFLAAVGLLLLSNSIGGFMGDIQWFSLLSLPILALYDGTRGKHPMKYLFYLYYPLHLLVLYAIGYCIYVL